MVQASLEAGVAAAKTTGLHVGMLVVHGSDPLVYKIRSVDGATVHVWISAVVSSTGEEINKSFPLDELRNVSVIISTFERLCDYKFRGEDSN